MVVAATIAIVAETTAIATDIAIRVAVATIDHGRVSNC